MFKNIKNKVRAFQKDGKVIVYILARTTRTVKVIDKLGNSIPGKFKIENKNLFDIQHNLRFRSIVYSCIIVSYHPEMDFTLALNSGWIEITN